MNKELSGTIDIFCEVYGFESKDFEILNYNCEKIVDEAIRKFRIKNNDVKKVAALMEYVQVKYYAFILGLIDKEAEQKIMEDPEIGDFEIQLMYINDSALSIYISYLFPNKKIGR